MEINNPITALEANVKLHGILEHFAAMASDNPFVKQYAVIENVAFEDVFYLYAIMQDQNRQLFLPGEIHNENITIVYIPCPGCTIGIESEPCVDYRWKVKHTNFNYN